MHTHLFRVVLFLRGMGGLIGAACGSVFGGILVAVFAIFSLLLFLGDDPE